MYRIASLDASNLLVSGDIQVFLLFLILFSNSLLLTIRSQYLSSWVFFPLGPLLNPLHLQQFFFRSTFSVHSSVGYGVTFKSSVMVSSSSLITSLSSMTMEGVVDYHIISNLLTVTYGFLGLEKCGPGFEFFHTSTISHFLLPQLSNLSKNSPKVLEKRFSTESGPSSASTNFSSMACSSFITRKISDSLPSW